MQWQPGLKVPDIDEGAALSIRTDGLHKRAAQSDAMLPLGREKQQRHKRPEAARSQEQQLEAHMQCEVSNEQQGSEQPSKKQRRQLFNTASSSQQLQPTYASAVPASTMLNTDAIARILMSEYGTSCQGILCLSIYRLWSKVCGDLDDLRLLLPRFDELVQHLTATGTSTGPTYGVRAVREYIYAVRHLLSIGAIKQQLDQQQVAGVLEQVRKVLVKACDGHAIGTLAAPPPAAGATEALQQPSSSAAAVNLVATPSTVPAASITAAEPEHHQAAVHDETSRQQQQAEALTSQTLLHAPGAAAATSVKPIVACDRDTQKTAPAAVEYAGDALTTGASQEPSHGYSILTVLAAAAVTAIVATAVASGMDDVVVEVLRLLALVQL